MKVLGLISGGKDSFYNLMQCAANGHTIIALGNLHPSPQDNKDELDSYMYQTVGHDVIHLYKDCMGLPLHRRVIKGSPIEQGSDYVKTDKDETEDLFELLQMAKEAHPDLEAVSVGAILSNYQRIRVESVCGRLGLVALSYLWQRNQEELLFEMAQAGVNAVLIKIAAIGLKRQHLGQSIGDMFPHLCKMNQEYDLHICGEGGEYETITLDCPLFKSRIVVDESEIVIHSDDAFAQVAYMRFKKLHLEEKSEDDMDPNWMSDMNLDPVWDADAIMMPIEDIVLSKQSQQLTGDVDEMSSTPATLRRSDSEVFGDIPSYRTNYGLHRGPIFCAVGGTTAYESGEMKHMSIAEETTVCLGNVQAKLEKAGLSWKEVVFMQVFVSNMADFGVVNGAYKAFFGINPPPRACVGANLPRPFRIQVSCTAIRADAPPKPRQTLHVQGMSYWAPANIGPYSQATEQAYHGFIAGQIGMLPSTLDLPVPQSLAKETAWSLRNLMQIATLREGDLANRTGLCIAYVQSPDAFVPVTAAWSHIANKKTLAPMLAVCMPSLPKGALVEWQVLMHQGKVYADRKASATEQDGYDTDDDDQYELEKRVLHPSVLNLSHEFTSSTSVFNLQEAAAASVEKDQAESGLQWKAATQSWFLSPLLAILSVVRLPELTLEDSLSTLSLSGRASIRRLSDTILKDMLAMMIKAVDRILQSHEKPASGPGVENGWKDVVGMSLFYHDTLVLDGPALGAVFEELLSAFAVLPLEGPFNIALTMVPVRAMADRGVLALTVHVVGRSPTIPGLLQ